MVHRTAAWVALTWLALTQAQGGIAAQKAPDAPSSPTVLVLPLENSGRDSRLDWLGEGLAVLTIERLAEEGRAVFSSEEVRATIERMGLPASTRFTRATMLRIAEQLDADYVVFGSFTSDGKELSITLRILRQTPASLLPPQTETGALENLMEVHARMAWQLLHFFDADFPSTKNSFAQNAPRLRLDAFESYVRGVLAVADEQRVRLWREAARLEPNWSDPAFALGQYYFAAKNYAEANAWFGRVAATQNHGVEAAFYDGVAHLLRSEPERAEIAFSSLLQLARPMRGRGSSSAELPEALNNLAIARARLRKWNDALAALQRAAKLDPGEPDYWFNLGLAAMRADEASAAVRPFRELLRRNPDDKQARALLILALDQAGRKSEADSERETAPGGLPNYSLSTLAGLDRVRMKLELSPAAAALQRTLSPRRVQALRRRVARGNEYMAIEKWEEARREFAEAVLLAPDTAEAHVGLAEANRRLGLPDEAVREFRAALWNHDDAATRVQLARLLIAMERPAEARTELRTALRLDTSGKLREEVRQLLSALDAKNEAGDRP